MQEQRRRSGRQAVDAGQRHRDEDQPPATPATDRSPDDAGHAEPRAEPGGSELRGSEEADGVRRAKTGLYYRRAEAEMVDIDEGRAREEREELDMPSPPMKVRPKSRDRSAACESPRPAPAG